MGKVSDNRIFSFPSYADSRGSLTCIDSLSKATPFEVRRVFWIYDVGENCIRGEHAHRTCEEMIIALHGSVDVELTDASGNLSLKMDDPCVALHIPAMCWCRFTNFSDDCVLLCLASEEYDAGGYINNYKDFLQELGLLK